MNGPLYVIAIRPFHAAASFYTGCRGMYDERILAPTPREALRYENRDMAERDRAVQLADLPARTTVECVR